MFSLIERLRKKTKNQKRFLALMVSGGFTFLIFIFWFSGNYLEKNSSLEEENLKVSEASPFEVLVKYSNGLVFSTVNVFSDIKSVFQKVNLEELYGLVSKEETKESELNESKEPQEFEEKSEGKIYKIKDREGFVDKGEEVNFEDVDINIDSDEEVNSEDEKTIYKIEDRESFVDKGEEVNFEEETISIDKDEEVNSEDEKTIYKIEDRESFDKKENGEVNSEDEKINIDKEEL